MFVMEISRIKGQLRPLIAMLHSPALQGRVEDELYTMVAHGASRQSINYANRIRCLRNLQ